MEEGQPVSDKVLNKLLEVISKGCGHLYGPVGKRREADAQAYSLTTLAKANTEAQIQHESALQEADFQRRSAALNHEHDLAQRSARRTLHQALLKQENLERVFAKSLENPPDSASAEPVDQDWLTDFVARAEKVSSEHMQTLWARILSLEVGSPGSFSVRSMDVLKSMTAAEANAFRKLCAVAATLGHDRVPVVIINGRREPRWFNIFALSETENLRLYKCGIALTEELALKALGLIHDKELCIPDQKANTVLDFNFYARTLRVQVLKDRTSLAFINFTGVGAELYRLIQEDENCEYVELLQEHLKKVAKVDLIEPA